MWNSHRCPFFKGWKDIKWSFNPVYSHQWGGHYEIMIKAAKKAMADVLGWPQTLLDDEELRTLFRRVQGILNSRPLTDPDRDLADGPPLTPGSFLMTGLPILGTPMVNEQGRFAPREGRRQLDEAMEEVRKRFHSEYLAKLKNFLDKSPASHPLAPGLLVYILHPPSCCSPGQWELYKKYTRAKMATTASCPSRLRQVLLSGRCRMS